MRQIAPGDESAAAQGDRSGRDTEKYRHDGLKRKDDELDDVCDNPEDKSEQTHGIPTFRDSLFVVDEYARAGRVHGNLDDVFTEIFIPERCTMVPARQNDASGALWADP